MDSSKLEEWIQWEKWQEYDLDPGIIISVTADYAERPEMAISPRFFRLFEQLNAELDFEVAYERFFFRTRHKCFE